MFVATVPQQVLIDPLMQAADVADDRPWNARDVVGRRVACRPHPLERLEAHAERKQVDTVAEAGRALPEPLGRDEHEIRLAEQLLFAGGDPFRLGRARGQIVDAVVDRQLAVEPLASSRAQAASAETSM